MAIAITFKIKPSGYSVLVTKNLKSLHSVPKAENSISLLIGIIGTDGKGDITFGIFVGTEAGVILHFQSSYIPTYVERLETILAVVPKNGLEISIATITKEHPNHSKRHQALINDMKKFCAPTIGMRQMYAQSIAARVTKIIVRSQAPSRSSASAETSTASSSQLHTLILLRRRSMTTAITIQITPKLFRISVTTGHTCARSVFKAKDRISLLIETDTNGGEGNKKYGIIVDTQVRLILNFKSNYIAKYAKDLATILTAVGKNGLEISKAAIANPFHKRLYQALKTDMKYFRAQCSLRDFHKAHGFLACNSRPPMTADQLWVKQTQQSALNIAGRLTRIIVLSHTTITPASTLTLLLDALGETRLELSEETSPPTTATSSRLHI